MATPKLHEVLAVEGDLEAAAKKVIDEAVTTFSKKPNLFMAMRRELRMFDATRENENTVEQTEMVTTVPDKLRYIRGAIVKYWNTFATKEATNQVATADLVVDGVTLATALPATVLLGLESKLKLLRSVYDSIPTLQPGVNWRKADDHGAGVYVTATPEETFQTEKVPQARTLYEATKEHPAQIEKWTADVKVGKYTKTVWSGMLSPAEKSALLGRIDTLLRAVKRARQRANSAEVVKVSVGDTLFDYIHG